MAESTYSTTIGSDEVVEILDEMHAIMEKHDKHPAALIAAVAWLSVNVCHNYGVVPESFADQFLILAQQPYVELAPPSERS